MPYQPLYPHTHTSQALASSPLPLPLAPVMYKSPAYPDSSFHPAASNSHSSPPPPPHLHHYQYPYHPHGSSNSQLYSPSPPQGASPSSGSGSFLSAPPSFGSSSIPSSYLQRSSSALSLRKPLFDHNHHHDGDGSGSSNPNNNHHLYEQPDLFDFQVAGPIRRVFSTGDLQGMNNLQPLATENCSQEVGGNEAAIATSAGGRVGRYTVEERKERIERYRSKRSQRNFQKKITYACRKMLADSRPRIRGRFTRNGEAELEAEAEVEAREVNSCNNASPHDGFDYYYCWGPAMDDEADYSCDPEFWANFFNNLSVNALIPDDMYSNKG